MLQLRGMGGVGTGLGLAAHLWVAAPIYRRRDLFEQFICLSGNRPGFYRRPVRLPANVEPCRVPSRFHPCPDDDILRVRFAWRGCPMERMACAQQCERFFCYTLLLYLQE